MLLRARRSLVLLAIGLSHCARPATQVLLTLDSNALPERSARLTISSLAENVTLERLRAAPDARVFDAVSGALFPSSVTVVPPAQGARSRTVTVRLHLRLEASAAEPAADLERVHRVTLIEGRSLRARVFFNLQCAAAAQGCTTVSAAECTASIRCLEQGQTCGDDGQCVPTDLDAERDPGLSDAALVDATDGADRSDAALCRGCAGRCVAGECRPAIEAIVGGDQFTCGLLQGGAVHCWGDNSEGQLGDGTTTARATPAPVTGILTARALAAGAGHACVALTNGEGRCWGRGSEGQLGNGAMEQQLSPVTVTGLSNARIVAAGSAHSFAARTVGLASWGDNADGQLGTGDTASSAVARSFLPGNTASVASARGQSTCVVFGSRVFCWGRPFGGAAVGGACMFCSSGLAFSQVAVGQQHACARAGRSVRCWGDNSVGQLGDGTTSERPMMLTTVMGLTDVEQLVSGARFSCALTVDRRVFCWGDNTYGQLGDGTTTQRVTPVPVLGLTDALLLGAGSDHVCALRRSGPVVCWGRNDGGQLGDGTRSASSVPVASRL